MLKLTWRYLKKSTSVQQHSICTSLLSTSAIIRRPPAASHWTGWRPGIVFQAARVTNRLVTGLSSIRPRAL